jgi:cytochrome bd-type quinol oxidase subunit 1
MKTANGVSPSVSATDIWISILVFLVVFVALGVADAWMMLRYGRRPLGQDPLAKITSPEDAGAPASGVEGAEEDDSALVY